MSDVTLVNGRLSLRSISMANLSEGAISSCQVSRMLYSEGYRSCASVADSLSAPKWGAGEAVGAEEAHPGVASSARGPKVKLL